MAIPVKSLRSNKTAQEDPKWYPYDTGGQEKQQRENYSEHRPMPTVSSVRRKALIIPSWQREGLGHDCKGEGYHRSEVGAGRLWEGFGDGGFQETRGAARLRRGRDDRVEGRATRVPIAIGGPGMETATREREREDERAMYLTLLCHQA